MSVKNCEKLEKNEVLLTIEVGAEEFEAAVEKAYREKRREINVPGFRKGKAPRNLIEKMYGEGVFYSDAIDNCWFDAYKAAVLEKELRVVGEPTVELAGEVTKEGFTFTAKVPVYPEVTLGQYKGLSAPKAEVKVLAADVNARLKDMAERNSRMVSVERAVAMGDTAVIDFEGFDQGVPFEGGKGENFSLEIGSGSFVPGFEDQLVGMTAGEEKDIDITFPEQYHEGLAGKPVVFHVKVNEVKTKEVPAIDDEFAKDVSEFDTLKELKADLKKKITAERKEAAEKAFEDALMAQVAENIICDVPDAMVESQARHFLDNFRMQLQQQGMSYEQYLEITNADPVDMLQQAKEPALRQVRMDLAMTAIIEAEKIEATEAEVEKEYADMAEKYGMDVETVKKYLTADVVSDQIKSQKAIRIVTASATVAAPAEEQAEEAEKAE